MMKNLRIILEQEFNDVFYDGTLPYLSFPAQEEKYKLLFVSGEHGDKTKGPQALLGLAEELREHPLHYTHVDIVPALDLSGYPYSRTLLDGSFGNENYFDKGYFRENQPQEIVSLIAMIHQGDYNLSVLASENFIEETPSLQGYFMFHQVNTTKDNGIKKMDFVYPEMKDLNGTLIHALMRANITLLNPKNPFLGDGHVVGAPGHVLQSFKIGKEVLYRTKNEFANVCLREDTPAIVLFAPDSTEKDLHAKSSHKVALDTILHFYESIKK